MNMAKLISEFQGIMVHENIDSVSFVSNQHVNGHQEDMDLQPSLWFPDSRGFPMLGKCQTSSSDPLVNTRGYPSDPGFVVINGRSPAPPPFGAPLKKQKTSPWSHYKIKICKNPLKTTIYYKIRVIRVPSDSLLMWNHNKSHIYKI